MRYNFSSLIQPFRKQISCLSLVMSAAFFACAPKAEHFEPVDLVYPLLDTENSRWFYFSSACRPFGMVNLSPDTQIGGASPDARNVIAGNNGDGIALWQAGTSGTVIQGNYVGGSDQPNVDETDQAPRNAFNGFLMLYRSSDYADPNASPSGTPMVGQLVNIREVMPKASEMR